MEKKIWRCKCGTRINGALNDGNFGSCKCGREGDATYDPQWYRVYESVADLLDEKDKLIEQMRKALKMVNDVSCNLPPWCFDGGGKSVVKVVESALEAAERNNNE